MNFFKIQTHTQYEIHALHPSLDCTASPPPSSSNAHKLPHLLTLNPPLNSSKTDSNSPLPLLQLIALCTTSINSSPFPPHCSYNKPLSPLSSSSSSSYLSSIMKKDCASNTTTLLFSLVLVLGEIGLASCDSLQDKCAPEFTKLGECLSYASAKADTPSAACCGSATEIRQKDAVCLCYIIQQAHGGGSSVSSLGLQLDRLIKLPAACKLANTNISDCPKLLNLPPTSPDYGIFTNATKATTTPTGPSSSSSSSSEGTMNKIHFAGFLAVTMISALYSTIF